MSKFNVGQRVKYVGAQGDRYVKPGWVGIVLTVEDNEMYTIDFNDTYNHDMASVSATPVWCHEDTLACGKFHAGDTFQPRDYPMVEAVTTKTNWNCCGCIAAGGDAEIPCSRMPPGCTTDQIIWVAHNG